jgi:hypothetical protein
MENLKNWNEQSINKLKVFKMTRGFLFKIEKVYFFYNEFGNKNVQPKWIKIR